MNEIIQFFRNLGPVRLAAMATVGFALIAFFAFITMRLTTPSMSLLYTDLDLADSTRIVQSLDSAGVSYRVSGDGATILVPEDRVTEMRMAVAQEGMIGGASVGYEIFDRTDALGTTSFVQNINHVRALEGELARTIRSIDNITSARVHLVLPQRQLFSRDERRPSASIAIKTRGMQPGSGQIRAVQNLVASAVPDLDANRVSIIDHKGVMLAKGAGEDVANSYFTTLEEKRLSHERRLREQVEALLERTVGLGKVRAEVAVVMDMDRLTRNSETFDPDGQVARSTVTVEDRSSEADGETGNNVTIANNLPDADMDEGAAGYRNESNSDRLEETVNFEISRTMTTHVQEAGAVQRLSVAVLVDGTYEEGPDGERVYQPRSEQELAKLTSLVQSAIGFDQNRADNVEVVNMRFADVMGSVPTPVEINVMGFEKNDLLRITEILVLGVVGILVIFLVLRPLIHKMASLPAPTRQHGSLTGEFPPGSPQPALAGPGMAGGMPALQYDDGAPRIPTDDAGRPLTARQIAEKPGGLDTAIEVAAVESRVQGSAIKKVGELIERHPDEAASVIRGWLYGG
ncbi:MAG: flagellar basal-body MS-ring/collar protein FliF [Sphingomonadales bacterium]